MAVVDFPPLRSRKNRSPSLVRPDFDEILQTGNRGGVAPAQHQRRGEGAELPLPTFECSRPDRAKWRLLKKVAAGEPIQPSITILAQRLRKGRPWEGPMITPVGDRDADRRPALDHPLRGAPSPHQLGEHRVRGVLEERRQDGCEIP